MFKRRLGEQNNVTRCVGGFNCAQILEKHDGNFAVVGKLITEEAREAMLPGAGVGQDEGVVEIPRRVLLDARSDIPTV